VLERAKRQDQKRSDQETQHPRHDTERPAGAALRSSDRSTDG
jgi:hypothetical protein